MKLHVIRVRRGTSYYVRVKIGDMEVEGHRLVRPGVGRFYTSNFSGLDEHQVEDIALQFSRCLWFVIHELDAYDGTQGEVYEEYDLDVEHT